MADLLPPDVWHSIFDYLELADLSSCALVNKEFNLLVRGYPIQEIEFIHRSKHGWFHPDFSFYQHRVDCPLAFMPNGLNFDYLKRLKIDRLSSFDDLEEINKFTQLEELDLNLKSYGYKKSQILSLANLKVLYIFVPGHVPYVELDTPRLAKVGTFDLKRLEFVYPDEVRCIYTFAHSGKLSTFSNLEYLTFTDYYNEWVDSSSSDFKTYRRFEECAFSVVALKKLKKLKEIDFYFNSEYGSWYYIDVDMFQKMIANLLALGRPDLKVFWYSVQVTDSNRLSEYDEMSSWSSLRDRTFDFQLLPYEQLKDKVEFFWHYEFCGELYKFSSKRKREEFFSTFFARFCPRKISIGRIYDRYLLIGTSTEELLMKLIASSPSLLILEFNGTELGQSFFDRMPKIVRQNRISLRYLHLNGSNGVYYLEFVSRLRDLELFKTDHQLSFELIEKLSKMPRLIEFQFRFGLSSKRIERTLNGGFLLNGKSLNQQQLLQHFQSKLSMCLLM